MPLPSNENDLKRRARRRLIGAVALTLAAVIVLPLLLENEPPPASSLAVRMAVAPAPKPVQAILPAQSDEPDGVAAPVLPPPHQAEAQPASAAKPEPVKPEPVKHEAARPTPKPAPAKTAASIVAPPQPAAASSEMFVVQLAALSDAAKAQELKERAAKLGLPAFTDKVGHLTRVRVGPYSSRETAVAAAVKLAESKMTGQVLTQ